MPVPLGEQVQALGLCWGRGFRCSKSAPKYVCCVQLSRATCGRVDLGGLQP